MEHDYKIELSKRRLEIAHERLTTAKAMLELGDYKASANRLYYAIFSAMRAVLALDGFDSKKHSGIIARFRQSYIKTGILDTEMSKIIDDLEVIREDSFFVSPKDSDLVAENASRVISDALNMVLNESVYE